MRLFSDNKLLGELLVINKREMVAKNAARLIAILLNSGIIFANTKAIKAISMTGIKILFFNRLASMFALTSSRDGKVPIRTCLKSVSRAKSTTITPIQIEGR